MDERERTPQKHRRPTIWRILLLLLLIVVIAFAIFRLRLKWQLNARIEAIRAAGYPVTCDELDAWHAIPRDVENAALTILDAFPFYQKWDMELEDLPLIGRAKLPARTEPLADEMKALITKYIADNNEAIELLHAGAKIEHCRYPLGYETWLPTMSGIKRGCQLLSLETLLYAENDQTASSVDSILSAFGLAHSLVKEPLLVAQFVRMACHSLSMTTLERLTNRMELTDEQMIELSERLYEIEQASDLTPAFAGERCMRLDFFRAPTSLGPGFHPDTPARPILEILSIVGLVDMDAGIYLDLVNEYMEATRLPYSQRQKAVAKVEDRLASLSKIHILAHALMPALRRITIIELKAIAHLRAARVGLAVQRYRLAAGKLPDTLSQLVPTYLNAVPKDPFDGNELRYKKRGAAFIIYSIGQDLSDDGGAELLPRDKRPRGKPRPNWDVTFIVEG